jgi:tRNA(Ile2) C34 agmatinyltransferase TiaS
MDCNAREKILQNIFYRCRSCGKTFSGAEATEILNNKIELGWDRHRHLHATHECDNERTGLGDLIGWAQEI